MYLARSSGGGRSSGGRSISGGGRSNGGSRSSSGGSRSSGDSSRYSSNNASTYSSNHRSDTNSWFLPALFGYWMGYSNSHQNNYSYDYDNSYYELQRKKREYEELRDKYVNLIQSNDTDSYEKYDDAKSLYYKCIFSYGFSDCENELKMLRELQ